MSKTVADVLEMAANVKMVDLRFTDLPGMWQHFTIPAHVLSAEMFEDGIGSTARPSAASRRFTSPTCC